MNNDCRRAFTIVELFAIICIIALIIGILFRPLGHIHHSTPNVRAQANLRSLNTGAANFAGDQDDSIFAITKDGQIQDALQRATNRVESQEVYIADQMLLHIRYSHVVLLDYLTDRQPEPIAASPFDKKLIDWQENPLGYLDADSDFPYAEGLPKKAGYDMDPMWVEEVVKQLWGFGSSYQVVAHAWVDDVEPQFVPSSGSPHHMVKGESDELLGGRKMSEVAFPSQKVFMYEEFDRFSDPKGIYAAYSEAKANLAFFDGSVRQEMTGDANSAFDAENPDLVWEQRYLPLDVFPVPMEGLGELKKLDLRFRWAKGGLGGVDFGGE